MRPPPPRPDWAWFLDIDGTLARLAPTPDRVVIDDATRRLVAALRELAQGAVALVSGRAISDIDRLFADDMVAVSGQHGSERRRASGSVVYGPRPSVSYPGLVHSLRPLARAHPGLRLEDKGLSLALHYREAPQLEALVEAAVTRAHAEFGDGYLVQSGKMVLEIVPVGRSKGSAVDDFMAEPPFAGRIPVFLGDDVSDEHAFKVVNRRNGYSVKVGEGSTVARYRLHDVADVLQWLSSVHSAGEAWMNERPSE